MCRLKINPDRTQCKRFGLKASSDCNSVSKLCGKSIECVKTLFGHVLANQNSAGRSKQNNGLTLTLYHAISLFDWS